MSTNTDQKKEVKRTRRVFAAREKCEAVLSVWSERRKPAQVCREMEITWQQFENWQKTAMKAMIQALEPRRMPDGGQLPQLSPRMEKLLETTDTVVTRRNRAEARLASIQKTMEAKKSRSSGNSKSA